jgi:hypothetical protein
MHTKELVNGIRDYTKRYDMPFERYLMLTEVADRLEQLSAENKQLRNDLIMQTALAQNGQSAIETNKQLRQQLVALKAERDAAVEDLKRAIDSDDVCTFCKHDVFCQGDKCDKYIEGKGATNDKGELVDWDWTCMDFNYGTCPKLENTPCDGCFENDMSGFEWRGVQCE